jgi:hypothetical protein
MLAKCPNTMRVLRYYNFGKQKFSDEWAAAASFQGAFCAQTKKNALQPPLNNVLYR